MKGVYEFKKGKEDTRALSFVMKATYPDDTRHPFELIEAKGGELAATDGKRVHVAKNDKVEDGLYTPYKITGGGILLVKSFTKKLFPNWRNTVEMKTKGDRELFDSCISFSYDKERRYGAYSQIIHKAGLPVNIRFLNDLPIGDYLVRGNEGGTLIHMANNLLKIDAYIMGMIIQD